MRDDEGKEEEEEEEEEDFSGGGGGFIACHQGVTEGREGLSVVVMVDVYVECLFLRHRGTALFKRARKWRPSNPPSRIPR